MVEITESAVFIFLLLICVIFDIVRAVKTRKREWMLLFLFHVLYLFSSIYYELFIIFFEDEPYVTHISEIGWYVSYLFLTLLLQNIRDKEMDNKKYKALLVIPVFTFAMAIGFIIYSEGDVFSNVICALLMWILLHETVKGALFCHEKYGRSYNAKWLYRSSFIFCLLEYITWVLSCIFWDESWTNPYYWSDILLAASFLLFIPSVAKIVNNSVTDADKSLNDALSASRSEE